MPAGVYARHNGDDVKRIEDLERQLSISEAEREAVQEKIAGLREHISILEAKVQILQATIIEAMYK